CSAGGGQADGGRLPCREGIDSQRRLDESKGSILVDRDGVDAAGVGDLKGRMGGAVAAAEIGSGDLVEAIDGDWFFPCGDVGGVCKGIAVPPVVVPVGVTGAPVSDLGIGG